MRFGMSHGPHIFRAPENDQGSDPGDDLDEDFSLDPPDDDEPEPDDDQDDLDTDLDDADADADDDEPPARQSRGESRQARLARERNELRERLDRQERELAELRASQRPQTPAETPEQRQQRLANMEPWERTEYLRQESERSLSQRLQQIEFQSQDSRDQLSYDSLAARHPVADKLRDKVEAKLADLRKGGFNAPRRLILEQILGEQQLSNAGRATNRAKKAADGNRDRQAARAPSGRGDAEAGDRRASSTSAAREKRLGNISI